MSLMWMKTRHVHCKKELAGPTNGLLINNLSGVLNQHMPILGIVMITVW